MSIFGDIVSRVFRGSTLAPKPAEARPASEQASMPAAEPAHEARAAPSPASMPGTAAPAQPVDVEAVLAGLEARAGQRLDWRSSIVDLMKLLDLDSSLAARSALARELGYGGALDGSAAMNTWLHRAVMRKLAENGGRVPDSLRD
jgi:hypothetical protein